MTSTPVRLWTVDDYHRMIEAQILTNEDRVELLEGQILQMSPQQPPHAATTQRASDSLRTLLTGRATIRVQLPITLRPNSEPEPDVAVVGINADEYQESHPTPDDIFLIVEVADTTLYTDRKQKASAYAKAEIREYWVLNVQKRQVYVFRQPKGENYQQEILLNDETTLSLVAFPEIIVSTNQLFPPKKRSP
ncbi:MULTISPECIES: Uma2 family endonuclease [unclassified Coleofasciculus]|uniref:Uma2 family endonuclease n=1 Tax=unclassified Coleofasciculus TaxID=2692782 RepID=UPI0018824429|nr:MULTISPECIES: Uma2 family endonuclease [unclassified Coleofasciculus]MBE9129248.1 Uma2 family endonuclease [Coleofasciculus sp. LEGE 07081]MBE9151906.1 Uma2 family endonuclease [Coleofasciculus sp. LEGE 07092]